MNRTTPHQTEVFEISARKHIEILNNFIFGEVPLWYKVCTDILLYAINYNKLQ